MSQMLSKHENRSIVDICTELLNKIWKLVASQTAKVDAEPELVDEPKPEVVDEPNPKSKVKVLIETHVDLPAEPTMKW